MTLLFERHANGPPSGLTFRITQPYGPRVSYLRTHPSLRKGLNRIFTGYQSIFASQIPDNDVKYRKPKKTTDSFQILEHSHYLLVLMLQHDFVHIHPHPIVG
jgi:hypothetical protein